MKTWIKITIGIVAAFIISFIAGGAIFFKMLRASLPEYSGEVRAQVKNSVEVFFDSLAVPYIIAQSDEDAAFTLGYLHARERLFMMDLIRRAGEGRLSEILGPQSVPFDKMFRTVGIARTIKSNLNKYNAVTLKLLQAYSNGVNKYIAEAKGKYPVEFDVLGYDPEEWKPEHSLITIRMMAWELNIGWWVDFAFSELAIKLGEDKVKEILPDYPQNAPYVIPSGLKSIASIDKSFLNTDRRFRNFIGWKGTHIGSNNWVVNAGKSCSGKPIVANDPHLAFSAPGKWYAAVLITPGNKTSGITLPGVPGVVIGKNDNISWVLTNVMTDDCDFFTEKLDLKNKKYFLDGNWNNLKVIKDTIKVKDSLSVTLEIYETHRGPVISGIHPYTVLYENKHLEVPAISMRWLGRDFSDEFLAFYSINKAKNWDEFKSSFQSYSVPGQNFVYADKEGNIGYVFGSRLPVRGNNRPTLLIDGTISSNDWKGVLLPKDIPNLFNPSSGYIASANNKTLENFNYHISNLWEPPSRIDRITELLNSKEKHSAEDFMNYQMDVISPYAKSMTQYILEAFRNIKIKDKNLSESLDLLSKWNYEFNSMSQTPSIYAYYLKYLLKNVFEDEMGNDLYNEFVFVGNVPYRSIVQVLENPGSGWFDIKGTKAVETRNEIIRRSLSDALTELEEKFGNNIKNWQWGTIHKVTFRHAFGGNFWFVDKVVNIGPYPVGGDGTTIFNTEYPFFESIEKFSIFRHEEFENDLGPSMRYIYDFAKPDEFYLVLTTGQSGNIMSDHYSDMAQMWLEGKYMKIRTDEKSIRKNTSRYLRLFPE